MVGLVKDLVELERKGRKIEGRREEGERGGKEE